MRIVHSCSLEVSLLFHRELILVSCYWIISGGVMHCDECLKPENKLKTVVTIRKSSFNVA